MTSGARLTKAAEATTFREHLNSNAYSYYSAKIAETSGDGGTAKGLKRLFAAALLSSTSVMAFGAPSASAQAACPSTGPNTYVCSGASTTPQVFAGDDIVVTGDTTWDQNTTGIAPAAGANTGISVTGEDTTARNYGSITTGVVPSAYALYGEHHGLSVVATSGGSYALNHEEATITTTASGSFGLFAQSTDGQAVTVNEGLLEGSGEGNKGMRSRATNEGDALATNRETGIISMTGDWNTGMEARAPLGTATATNDGSIHVTAEYGATGINVYGDTANGTNNGLIEVESEYAVGMAGSSYSPATTTLVNNGTITATGNYTTGIVGSGPTVYITNAAGATITSDDAAIRVGYANGGTVANYGTITGDVSTGGGMRKRMRRGAANMTVRNEGSIDGRIDFRGATSTHVINHGGTVGDGSTAVSVGGYGNNIVDITGNGNDINGILYAQVMHMVPDEFDVVPLDAPLESHSALNFSQTDTLTLDVADEGAAVVGFDEINFNSGTTLFSGSNIWSPFGEANIYGGATVTTDSAMFDMGISRLNVSGEGIARGTLFAPAGSEISVSGDVVFEAGGRLRIGVEGDDDAGSLYAGGTITFEEGSEIYADLTSGISLTPDSDLLVATGGEGLTNNGLTVYDNSILFNFTADLRDNELYLVVQRMLTAAQATDNNRGRSNAQSIAAAIDAFLQTAPTDNPIVVFLSQFPVEEQEAQLYRLVQDSLPSEAGSDGSSTIVSSDMVLDLVMDRLSGGGFAVVDSGTRESGLSAGDTVLGGPSNLALWGRFGGAMAEYTPDNVNGFDSDTFAASIGIDGDISARFRAGIAVFYSSTKVDETGAGANSTQDIEGIGALLYGTYRPSDFYVNATLGYGVNSYESRRTALGGVNSADYDGSQVMARVEAGKVFTHGSWDITPNVGARFNYVSIDGYTETGPLPTTVDSQNVTSLRAALGVSARYTHEMENGAKLIPEAYIRGLEELADPNEALTGSIMGGGTFVSQSTPRDRFSLAAGGGVTYEIDDKISVRVLYDGEFQSDYKEHSLTAAIRFAF